MPVELGPGQALLLVDIQNDFLPLGSLAVPRGDEIVDPLNRAIEAFESRGLPVFATRDWHPPDHCSFREQGGPWPPHCVAHTKGAEFSPSLHLPRGVEIVSKAFLPEKDAYSGFEGTDLDSRLREKRVRSLFVGGLATEYCVLNTAIDARKQGYEVLLLSDAVRAVNVHPSDESRALARMREAGVQMIQSSDLVPSALRRASG